VNALAYARERNTTVYTQEHLAAEPNTKNSEHAAKSGTGAESSSLARVFDFSSRAIITPSLTLAAAIKHCSRADPEFSHA
jgi:hypothetical protein